MYVRSHLFHNIFRGSAFLQHAVHVLGQILPAPLRCRLALTLLGAGARRHGALQAAAVLREEAAAHAAG